MEYLENNFPVLPRDERDIELYRKKEDDTLFQKIAFDVLDRMFDLFGRAIKSNF